MDQQRTGVARCINFVFIPFLSRLPAIKATTIAAEDIDDGKAAVRGKLPPGALRDAFGLATHDGEVSHSASVAVGMGRIVLGVNRSDGFEPAMWLTRVRTNPGRILD